MARRPPSDLNIVAAFYRRWSPHEDKRREIADDHKLMFAEAKSEGLNPKALRKAFAEQYRVENQTADQAEKRNETDSDVELYLSALARVREDEPEHDAETGEVIEPDAAMLPQTAGSETAVSAGAPEGEHSPHASEPIRRMSMTPLEPREAGGLKGFGFTVRFDEPAPLSEGVAAVGGGSANHPVASAAVTTFPADAEGSRPTRATDVGIGGEASTPDHSKPNPICRDPGDCGVYASWAMPCQVCKAAAAHRSAA